MITASEPLVRGEGRCPFCDGTYDFVGDGEDRAVVHTLPPCAQYGLLSLTDYELAVALVAAKGMVRVWVRRTPELYFSGGLLEILPPTDMHLQFSLDGLDSRRWWSLELLPTDHKLRQTLQLNPEAVARAMRGRALEFNLIGTSRGDFPSFIARAGDTGGGPN